MSTTLCLRTRINPLCVTLNRCYVRLYHAEQKVLRLFFRTFIGNGTIVKKVLQSRCSSFFANNVCIGDIFLPKRNVYRLDKMVVGQLEFKRLVKTILHLQTSFFLLLLLKKLRRRALFVAKSQRFATFEIASRLLVVANNTMVVNKRIWRTCIALYNVKFK